MESQAPTANSFFFFEFDPIKGKGRQLASTSDRHPNFDISPDGALLAWPIAGAIRFLSLASAISSQTIENRRDGSPSSVSTFVPAELQHKRYTEGNAPNCSWPNPFRLALRFFRIFRKT